MKLVNLLAGFTLVLLTMTNLAVAHPQYVYKKPSVVFNVEQSEAIGSITGTGEANTIALESTTELNTAKDFETTTISGQTSGTEAPTTETGQTSDPTSETGETSDPTTGTAQTSDPTTETVKISDVETSTETIQPTSTEMTEISGNSSPASERITNGRTFPLPPEKIEQEEVKISGNNLKIKCRNQQVGSRAQFKFICDGIRPDLITLRSEHILWLMNDGSGQIIDIEVPNYKISELIKAGYKTTTRGKETEINVLLKRPEQDADAEVADLIVPVPSPSINLQYESPISKIIHFPTNKKYRALSAPIIPPA